MQRTNVEAWKPESERASENQQDRERAPPIHLAGSA
jgi:hypothetical protein